MFIEWISRSLCSVICVNERDVMGCCDINGGLVFKKIIVQGMKNVSVSIQRKNVLVLFLNQNNLCLSLNSDFPCVRRVLNLRTINANYNSRR